MKKAGDYILRMAEKSSNLDDWNDMYDNKRYLMNEMAKCMTNYNQDSIKDVLTEYTEFLLKEGYCDSDVYCEPPTAIDRFMHKELRYK